MTLPKILEAYLDNGFSVIPVHHVEKGSCSCGRVDCPAVGKHPRTRRGALDSSKSKIDLVKWDQDGTKNWAIASGEPLPGGGFLAVLDVDPRNNGDNTLYGFEDSHGDLPETLKQNTGGGGFHYFFRTPEPVASTVLGPGLELKGKNSYVVAEPSGHVSGRSYKFENFSNAITIADLPEWVKTAAPKARPEHIEQDPINTFVGMVAAFDGILGDYLGQGKRAVKCPWLDQHSKKLWHAKASGTVILPARPGDNTGGFACLHEHCKGRTVSDFLKASSDAARAYARAASGMPEPAQQAHSETPEKQGDQVRVSPKELFGTMTKDGQWRIECSEANAELILRKDSDWAGLLYFDVMSSVICAERQPPFSTPWGTAYPRPWTDADDLAAQTWFQRGLYRGAWNEKTVRNAIALVAQSRPVDELAEYLNDLQWDGTSRVETWLTTYMGVVDTPYVRAVGRMWMVSAVARALDPGVKADHVLVLEGKTSLGKSQALEILASAKFFMSDLGNLAAEKTAAERIRTKWIVEDAEMTAIIGADAHVSKSFITRREDTYRAAYAKHAVSYKRRVVFAATVNEFSYLKDPTGNRRFWPVRVLSVDKVALVRDRDQLWAEAVQLYKSGEPWWPVDPVTADLCESEQERRRIADPWEKTLDLSAVKVFQSFGSIYAKLGIEPSKQTMDTEKRLTRVLQKLGYDTFTSANGEVGWQRK